MSEQLDRLERKVDLLLKAQGLTLEGVTTMSSQLTALQQQVAATTTVEQSAVTLIEGLAAQLQAAIQANNNGDTAALPALQQELASSAAALSAAITANTPAATPPAQTPPAATPPATTTPPTT